MAKKFLVPLRVFPAFEGLSEFRGIEADIVRNVRQDVDVADIKALLEEGAHHGRIIGVGAPMLFCKFQAFKRQPRVGLRRYRRQVDFNAHAGSDGINRIAPCTLEVTSFGLRVGVGYGRSSKGIQVTSTSLPRMASPSGNSARKQNGQT